jgi:hypothetical protein
MCRQKSRRQKVGLQTASKINSFTTSSLAAPENCGWEMSKLW